MRLTRHLPSKQAGRDAGFSLLEVLIVLGVLGMLTSVALPTYQEHVARGIRAEARAQLLLAGQYLQRFHAVNDSYGVDRAGANVDGLLPRQFSQSPAYGSPVYRIEFGQGRSMATATQFKLVMVPVEDGRMASDPCGGFTLDSSGRQGNTRADADREFCWH